MEEEQHRKRLETMREYIKEQNKGLRIENIRRDLRNSEESYKITTKNSYYLMNSIGKVDFKIQSATNTITHSSEAEFRNNHFRWYFENRHLLSPSTFTGQNRCTQEHPLLEVQGNVGFLDMPLEVFETLVWHLDGYSYYNMCRASSYINCQLKESLTNKKFQKYWKFRKNDLEIDLAGKTISSFNNVLEPSARPTQEISEVNWPHIFEICANLEYVLEDSVMSSQPLYHLEKAIKAELKLGFMYTYPGRITIPCGSLLCNVYDSVPNCANDENIHVLEDMDPRKCYRMGMVCKQKICNLHIMRLQQSDDSFVTLILVVCFTCISIYPLNEGQGCSISMNNQDNNAIEFTEDDIIRRKRNFCEFSEVLRNIVGVVVNSELVELHRISYYEEQVFAERLYKIHLSNFSGFFDDLSKLGRTNFVTSVKEVEIPQPLTDEEKSFYKAAQIDPPQVKGYAISFISFVFGHILIRPHSTDEIQRLDYDSVCKMSPKYYIQDHDLLHTMKHPVGACSGYGMDVIWSDEGMAVSFDSVTWHLKNFYDGVRLFDRRPDILGETILTNTLFVVSLTVCSPNLILVAIDHHLVFIRVRLVYPKLQDEYCPVLEYRVIRRIDLDLRKLNLQLVSLYFDFDKGEPYIFMELHKKSQLANKLRFYFRKIIFKQLDKNDDSGYLTDCEED